MPFQFIPVCDANIETVKKLHIALSQAGMVETVEECYSEAKKLSLWRPVALAKDGLLIGFAMYGLFLQEGANGRVWLDRFFIAEEYQKKGYATACLPLLIRHIQKEYNCDTIYLSVYENNAAAIHLYKKFGFTFNGETDINGEKVMQLNLHNCA